MTSPLTPTSRLGRIGLPLIGLGTWQSTPEEIDVAITVAVEAGYRHIDTAYAYMNEAAIGNTLRKIFEKGIVKREDLFIVTKLPHIALRPEYVETYIKRSLEALQLSYLDLYLIHNPVGFKNTGKDDFFPRNEKGQIELDMETDHIALWKAMEAQVDAGRTRYIGVSNFNLGQVRRLVENSRIPPACNQVELHIYLQQRELVSYCQEKDVTVCAYAPLGSPHLTAFNKIVSGKTDCKALAVPLQDPVVMEIAKKYNKTPAQVLLRYLIEYGVAVIPKSTNPDRIKQNFNIFDFMLSREDFQRVRALDRGKDGRMFADNNDFFIAMKKHPEYPFES